MKKNLNFRSRRGSAQAEAAMVLPLVILAVLTVIWLMVLFYAQTAARSGMHLALRCSAGILSDTVLCPEDERQESLYTSFLSEDKAEKLITEKAVSRIRAIGLSSVPELSGRYKKMAEFSTVSLHYKKNYSGMGLHRRKIPREGDSVQLLIDEAQWIRNGNWIRDEILRAKKE